MDSVCSTPALDALALQLLRLRVTLGQAQDGF